MTRFSDNFGHASCFHRVYIAGMLNWGTLGLTGTLGVSFYTEIVAAGVTAGGVVSGEA